jgi:hypothetical protein
MDNKAKFIKILEQATPFDSHDEVTEQKFSPVCLDHVGTEHRTLKAEDYLKEYRTEFERLKLHPDYTVHYQDEYTWSVNCDHFEFDFEYEKDAPFHMVCFTYVRRGRDQVNASGIRWRRDYLEMTVGDENTRFVTSLRITPLN